jgi:hypothetical protein
MGGNNFVRMSDAITNVAGRGQTVFNGDASDSFHNFGFCQYHNYVHPKKGFQEYVDQMNSYLYGPTFLSRVLDDTYADDTVYQILRRMNPGVPYDSEFGSREEKLRAYLLPVFYGGPRIPFSRTLDNPVLHSGALRQLEEVPFGQYTPQVLATLSPENLYSWLCRLYHHLHCQGSSMGAPKLALALNGHRWRSPFHDLGVVNFLSRMPEGWGRGLEMNHTKYPLKWVCRERIRFPYEVMAEGRHCYLYETTENISPAAEAMYRSGLTPIFKESLSGRRYRDILSPDSFDIGYLDRLAKDYQNGVQATGTALANTFSVVNLCLTGWYR